MEPTALTVGQTYYHLVFADRDMTMPGVQPIVFVGEVSFDDGSEGFAFQDTVSYVEVGSRLELAEEEDEVELYFMTEKDVRSLHSAVTMAKEVADAVNRGESMGFPVLKVLRPGWRTES